MPIFREHAPILSNTRFGRKGRVKTEKEQATKHHAAIASRTQYEHHPSPTDIYVYV